jgi:hypothetical protein
MEHLELHIITSNPDLETAVTIGLLDDSTVLACDNCESTLADCEGAFYSFVVILNEDDESWLVCEECYSPVVYPSALFELEN